mmetsp:Transcript_10881/g.19541  ORF Transcript_10881/g.19541 Transcript_10881/m.19541 type:complete len:122 (-) Transcript_10881:926-1291(-)|eukprot:CAMPEP_0201604102 /NCGR_PEP_ID=MMETSP0492-20130828/4344_1 /ASSEMBLY_ACC=CAM_ASM_000837 /TAXON_ID=420259 /ORGANISM="Thalassiosira gravida, Strain GMp14c1" /LENGTH=121 /DNA_ID=CAMNT_0048068053 /DNA_START=79 /DNA_END=444 /DNA_ORIENTATION=-
MSAEEVAKAFVAHYYQSLAGGADALAGLYNDQSMLTFEGQQVQGSANIINKLKSVGQVKHSVKTTDIQPSANPNAIVIFVTGAVQIGGDNPLHFCEFFHLVGTGPGQYYVHNDVFRLNYGL